MLFWSLLEFLQNVQMYIQYLSYLLIISTKPDPRGPSPVDRDKVCGPLHSCSPRMHNTPSSRVHPTACCQRIVTLDKWKWQTWLPHKEFSPFRETGDENWWMNFKFQFGISWTKDFLEQNLRETHLFRTSRALAMTQDQHTVAQNTFFS